MAGVSVGDLYVSLTSSGTTMVEKELQQVDRAAESTADAMTKVETAVERTGVASKVTARELAQQWGVFDSGARSQQNATRAAEQHVTVLGKQDRAQKQTAKTTDETAKATQNAATGTTTLSGAMQGLATVAGTVTPQMGTLASTIATMSTNGALVGAVIAGVSAIGAVYDTLTEKTRKAKEEQQALTNALLNDYRVRALGPGGQSQREVNAGVRTQQEQLKQLRNQLADAMSAQAAAPVMGAGAAGIPRTGKSVKQLRAEIAELELAIKDGGNRVIQARTKAYVEEITLEMDQLRELEKFGALRVDQVKKLASLEAQAVALRDQLADPNTRTTGITEQQRQELVLRLTRAVADEKGKEAKKTAEQKDKTDALVSSLAVLADAHELAYGDIQRAQQLYDAEAKALNDNTASVDRRAKALQRMRQLEKAGAVGSGPVDTSADPQGRELPDNFDASALFALPSEIRGMEKVTYALQNSFRGAISNAELGALLSSGINEAIQDAEFSNVVQGVSNLAQQFATFTTGAFTVALDAIAAGFTGGWDNFKSVLLGGLGSILQQMGQQLMTTGAALMGLLPALSNPFTSGPAMLAAGALIFGAGVALSKFAGAGRGGGAGGGGVGSGGIGGLGIGGPAAPNPYAFAAGTRVNGMTMGQRAADTRNTVVLQPTIIGVNDPQAQRAIKQMVSNAERRGIA